MLVYAKKTTLISAWTYEQPPQPFVEQGAVAGCCCIHNSFNISVGRLADTHDGLPNLFPSSVATT